MTPGKTLRRLLAVLLAIVLLLLVVLALIWQLWRPGLARYREHLGPAAAADAGLTVSWYGVSAVLIRAGDSAIFIDPFFSRPGGALRLLGNPALTPDEDLIRDWLQRAAVERLDAVLVSHSHYDHAMDAGVVARLTGARLVGSASTLNIGRGAGLPESRLVRAVPGETIAAGEFTLRFVASRHAGATGGRPQGDITAPLRPPARIGDYRQGGTFSILITHPRGRILHHGSAGFLPGALEGFEADVALLGVALIDALPEYLEHTARAVGAHTVYPVHWDDFTRPLDRPLSPMPVVVRLDRLFATFPGNLRLRTLELAEPVAVGP